MADFELPTKKDLIKIGGAQFVADTIGIHRRELHLFFFNLAESGSEEYRPFVKGLKPYGYDYDDWAWDEDGPPLPQHWDEDRLEEYMSEAWFEDIKLKIKENFIL